LKACFCDTNLCNTHPFKDGYLTVSSAKRRMIAIEAVVAAAVLAVAITMSVNGCGIAYLSCRCLMCHVYRE